MVRKLPTTMPVPVCSITSAVPADAQDDCWPRSDKYSTAGKEHAGIRVTEPVIGARDRHTVGGYYRNRYSNRPHGLAKRSGKLPSGLERRLKRNGTVLPGLQKPRELFSSTVDPAIAFAFRLLRRRAWRAGDRRQPAQFGDCRCHS